MVTTRAQARALSGSSANTASQPIYYESEDDSGFESANEDGDDEYRPRAASRRSRSALTDQSEDENEDEIDEDEIDEDEIDEDEIDEDEIDEDEIDEDEIDEDEMIMVQIPGQNATESRSLLQATNGDFSPSSSDQETTIQSIEPPDDVQATAQEGTYHQEDIPHDVVPKNRQSNSLTFFEEQCESGPPSFKDLVQLEFFQTFPHDPAATLCKKHFLQLAEVWFQRRQGHTEKTIYQLSQKYPYSRVESLLNYTRDWSILQQVIWDEPWRQMPHEAFMKFLREQLHWAEIELRERRFRAIVKTGKRPRCTLENCGVLCCVHCLAEKNNGGDLYEWVKEARAEGRHGEWQDEDNAAVGEWKRRGIEEEGERIDIRPEYVSVGGLHFIVDVCNGKTMIRFQ
ncbi:uncharacterized protein TRIVIDRAFT_226578 [Trichoderma virens Gv29-8]|uniref:Uncharacterized protein n=1 Tax=Hypocrea virens (strain Gv29-8 / FGSC 10586) TaxID=413071 RepID=G9N7C8_HYPVG|nr:uncharacterized protein TRIVIDRAFT_226578 [Trichoderma virens Gv29-8]EHK17625.1 hypothetical protein TRIVIDRAFT_226578 [Trichoderma virens Gv29-8]UKZ53659.1 hypothetical protein TrVGV298_007456 [Trichoderma virens]